MNVNPSLSGLYFYPIKSCAGAPVESWSADALGLVHDRRWMLTDEDGVFLTQRELPRMSLIKPRVEGDSLKVFAPGMSDELEIPLEANADRSPARVWDDVVEVASAGCEAADWFSEFLEKKCALVRLPQDSIRPVDPDFARPEDNVTLADGFPFLLISEASLEDLNSRLETPLPMNRFRPNLVVGGVEPFAEDGWREIRISGVHFRVVKPCARCTITTVEQTTGVKGKEPLTTLATFRRSPHGVLFGQNLIHETPGELSVGDSVEVLREAKSSGISNNL